MTNREKIEKLSEAKELLFTAMDLVRSVFPGDVNVKAYWLDQIAIHTSEDHGFLSRDLNIDTLIQRVGPAGFDKEVYRDNIVKELMTQHDFSLEGAKELFDNCEEDILDSVSDGWSFEEIKKEMVYGLN